MSRPIPARRRVTVAAVLTALGAPAALALPAFAAQGTSWAAPPPPDTSWVVQADPGRLDDVARAVAGLGGSLTSRQDLVSTATAALSPTQAAALAAASGVKAVTPDAPVVLVPAVPAATATAATGENGTSPSTPDDPAKDPYSLLTTTTDDGTRAAWKAGVTGTGVGVAILDSGIGAVRGLDAAGKLVKGIDLSLDTADSSKRATDYYGHGTHLAGIIAGDDAGRYGTRERKAFEGVAPDARVIDVKLGDSGGHVDVSQVIAGIDWTVANKNRLGIRVVNLSFNAGGLSSYTLDPVAFAAEQAWKHGLVVVVSAGNEGLKDGRLQNPAQDPYVLAVGAVDTGTQAGVEDDTVPSFSARGDGVRNPDLVAPGAHLPSLLAPGSHAAQVGTRVGDRLVRASGTSQAAAYASGAAALLISQRPGLTPDQVKYLLTTTARPLRGVDARSQGAGRLDVVRALVAPTPGVEAVQTFAPSTGLGLLDDSRGTQRLAVGDKVLSGEVDVWGRPFDVKAAAAAASGGDLAGLVWSLVPPQQAPLPTRTASPMSLANGDLSGASWSGASWSGASWSGASWSGASWSGASWSGASWSGASWSGASWSGASWSGASWS